MAQAVSSWSVQKFTFFDTIRGETSFCIPLKCLAPGELCSKKKKYSPLADRVLRRMVQRVGKYDRM